MFTAQHHTELGLSNTRSKQEEGEKAAQPVSPQQSASPNTNDAMPISQPPGAPPVQMMLGSGELLTLTSHDREGTRKTDNSQSRTRI